MPLTSDEAAVLGGFSACIERYDLPELAPIIAATLDDVVELMRKLDTNGGQLAIEMAAALAAELHKRRPPIPTTPPPQRARGIGSA